MNKMFKNKHNGRVVIYEGPCYMEGYVEKTENHDWYTTEVVSDGEWGIAYTDAKEGILLSMPLLAFLNEYELYSPTDDLLSVIPKFSNVDDKPSEQEQPEQPFNMDEADITPQKEK